MKNHSLALTLTAAALALTACTGNTQNADAPVLSPGDNPQAPTAEVYTWEAGPYPTKAPASFVKENPDSKAGWYMGSQDELANLEPQTGNFNTWQTIYSYKDATDPRGATIAVVFYDGMSDKCIPDAKQTNNIGMNYSDWFMEDQSKLNTAAYYEYVFNGEGRTYPHPNDDPEKKNNIQQMFVDETNSLLNLPQNIDDTRTPNPQVQDAEVYSSNASSYIGVTATEAFGKPGRTAEFFANYTKDSTGNLVSTGCATVYTALSNEAAATYDAAKFAEAHQNALEFAQEIQTMPTKKAL